MAEPPVTAGRPRPRRFGVRRRLRTPVRRLTGPLHRLPDFVIIGAQRGGTTSLFSWLTQHPDARPARTKEVHFFDDHYERGLNWYRQQFPIDRRGFAFEATPRLLYEPSAPARFAADLPDARAVVLLRDPARRALSHYHNERRKGREPRPFREAVWADPTSRRDAYRHRGHYREQLERWAGAIGWDRILVAISEELFAQPHRTVNDLVVQLGQAPFSFQPEHRNALDYDSEDLSELRAYFAERNRGLEELLGRPVPWLD